MKSPTQPKRKPIAIIASIVFVIILSVAGIFAGEGILDAPGTATHSQAGPSAPTTAEEASHLETSLTASAIPAYSGEAYIEVNGGIPDFDTADYEVANGTEIYGNLDSLGRCTGAFALVGRETQPKSKRGNISDIKPSGWKQNLDVYAVGLDHLYERSHLIAHKLTAEDANERNLVTGTTYLNQGSMYEFETIVDNYIDRTGGHVLMRVTPIFEGNELVPRGVQMEACSLEDGGRGVSFNVFCYNVQPGVGIDYATGQSWVY